MRYFKQAWNLIRQEKLFSSIYILGTGLSITVVMVLSIVYYVKIAPVYPENNRNRLLVVKSGVEQIKDGKDGDYTNSASLSIDLIERCIRPVEGIEALTVIYDGGAEVGYVQPEGNKEQLAVAIKYTDDAFWKVYDFRFRDGKPFTEADFQSGIYTAVITESLARKLFGRVQAAGEYISLDFRPYRIAGVVKDASFVTPNSYANVWVPYTLESGYKETFGESSGLGPMKAFLLVSPNASMAKVRNDIIDNINKYNQTIDKNITLSVNGQPDRQWQTVFRFWSNQSVDFTKVLLQYGLIFLVLLLVPAISLSGMTDSRMERRLAEMGIRRAFGSTAASLMRQIISENFLFTLLGGAAGLLVSYLLILVSADWIMELGQSYVDVPLEGTNVVFTPSMLLNLPVFAISLLVCFLLNLLTALVPAWRASHREIIYSLNAKQ